MFKTIFYCFYSLGLGYLPMHGYAHQPSVPPSNLQNLVATIQRVPEGRQLVDRVQHEGPIHIAVSHSPLASQFGAFWDASERIIYVNPSWHQTEGELIGSVIFELHNALATAKYHHLDGLASTGRISRNHFVESVERIEYENSQQAAQLAQRGVALGIFPPSTRLHVYRDFEEHFRYQKIGGHSEQIARMYDQIVPRQTRERYRARAPQSVPARQPTKRVAPRR